MTMSNWCSTMEKNQKDQSHRVIDVDTNIENYVIIDDDNVLTLREHYTEKCKKNPPSLSDNVTLKGVIFDRNKNIVCANVNIETFDTTFEDLKNIDWSNTRVFLREEGCYIRVFNYNNQWYISTMRKLFAKNSRWGSPKSFEQLFIEGLRNIWSLSNNDEQTGFCIKRDFFDKLNPLRIYTFIIRNTIDNRIVCAAPTCWLNTIYYAGYFENAKDMYTQFPKYEPCINDESSENLVALTEKIHILKLSSIDILSYSELVNKVENIPANKNPGIIVYYKSNNVLRTFNVLSKKYIELSRLRNNSNNILYRYIELRNEKYDYLKQFLDLFHDNLYLFESFEKKLTETIEYIYNQYVKRFEYNEYVFVSKHYYYIIKKLMCFKNSYPTEKVTLNLVRYIIENESHSYKHSLYYLDPISSSYVNSNSYGI